jgi:hypothetical protein
MEVGHHGRGPDLSTTSCKHAILSVVSNDGVQAAVRKHGVDGIRLLVGARRRRKRQKTPSTVMQLTVLNIITGEKLATTSVLRCVFVAAVLSFCCVLCGATWRSTFSALVASTSPIPEPSSSAMVSAEAEW